MLTLGHRLNFKFVSSMMKKIFFAESEPQSVKMSFPTVSARSETKFFESSTGETRGQYNHILQKIDFTGVDAFPEAQTEVHE